MGRRELRAKLQSTWHTFTPAKPGQPFRKKDLEDAVDVFEARAGAEARHMGQPAKDGDFFEDVPQLSGLAVRGLIGRFAK